MFVLRLTEGEEGLCGWSAGGGKLTLQPSDSLKDVIDDAAARWNLKGHRVELIYNGAILRGKNNDVISELLTKSNGAPATRTFALEASPKRLKDQPAQTQHHHNMCTQSLSQQSTFPAAPAELLLAT